MMVPRTLIKLRLFPLSHGDTYPAVVQLALMCRPAVSMTTGDFQAHPRTRKEMHYKYPVPGISNPSGFPGLGPYMSTG